MSINISEKLVLTNKCEPTPILQVYNCDVWNRMIIPSCEDLDTIGLCDKYYDIYGYICEQKPGGVKGCRAMPNTTCVKENCADWNRKITSSCDAINTIDSHTNTQVSYCNEFYDRYGRICTDRHSSFKKCQATPDTPTCKFKNCADWDRKITSSCDAVNSNCNQYYDNYGRICEPKPGGAKGCHAKLNTTCKFENCADWNRKITSSCDAINSNCNQYYDNYGRICEQKGGGNPGCHAKPNTTCKIK